jgi:hypothetical protein
MTIVFPMNDKDSERLEGQVARQHAGGLSGYKGDASLTRIGHFSNHWLADLKLVAGLSN